ncbi:hypothetical protein D4764_0014910 [Takifugu flavidus]|uniref:Uncharacterized protein n=1 Tax=Takifugu flavidus TaxID=433684 RepID=A0A5C6MDX7_9TELE|nr:hypothetical protein D4764_0014910 [Takifugu flavidus]
MEQTATRVAETVLDMDDVVVEENSLNVSIKRKNTDTKVKNDKVKKLSPVEQMSPAFEPAVDTRSLQDIQDMYIHSIPVDTQSTKSSLLDIQERDSSRDMQGFSVDNDDIKVEMHSGYSLSKFRSFLRTTKGMRSVQVEDYFPDLQLFQESTKYFMKTGSFGQPSFTDQEMYRLKKLLVKVWSRLERPHTFPLSLCLIFTEQ